MGYAAAAPNPPVTMCKRPAKVGRTHTVGVGRAKGIWPVLRLRPNKRGALAAPLLIPPGPPRLQGFGPRRRPRRRRASLCATCHVRGRVRPSGNGPCRLLRMTILCYWWRACGIIGHPEATCTIDAHMLEKRALRQRSQVLGFRRGTALTPDGEQLFGNHLPFPATRSEAFSSGPVCRGLAGVSVPGRRGDAPGSGVPSAGHSGG